MTHYVYDKYCGWKNVYVSWKLLNQLVGNFTCAISVKINHLSLEGIYHSAMFRSVVKIYWILFLFRHNVKKTLCLEVSLLPPLLNDPSLLHLCLIGSAPLLRYLSSFPFCAPAIVFLCSSPGWCSVFFSLSCEIQHFKFFLNFVCFRVFRISKRLQWMLHIGRLISVFFCSPGTTICPIRQ